MTDTADRSANRVELVLRTSRRNLMMVLVLILLFGATLVAHAVRPGTLLADWAGRAPWVIPVAAAGLFALARGPFAGRRRPPTEAELAVVLRDEFRLANLARAQRVALFTVLAAQFPFAAIGLLDIPAAEAAIAMAASSVTLGLVTLIASFLVFDRG